MVKLLGSQLKAFELADRASHADAMLALRQAVEGFVVIFARGSGDYLRGGEYRSRASGENIEIEKFLTRDDLNVFTGKVVFVPDARNSIVRTGETMPSAIVAQQFAKLSPLKQLKSQERGWTLAVLNAIQ